jgi:hypothetical protein
LGFVETKAVYDYVTHIPTYMFRESAKLLLETVLNPIINGFMFSFVFNDETYGRGRSAFGSARGYVSFSEPAPAFSMRKRHFGVAGVITGFFCAVLTAYAATLVFNWGGALPEERFGAVPVLIIFCVAIAALFLLAWLSPILRPDRRPHTGLMITRESSVLRSLLFSLIKMMVLNAAIIFVAGSFAGTAV